MNNFIGAPNNMEKIMDRNKQPSKESVREWLKQRQEKPAPLPEADQIRRELGWKFLEFRMSKAPLRQFCA
jgi:hypothetical protein